MHDWDRIQELAHTIRSNFEAKMSEVLKQLRELLLTVNGKEF